MTTPNDQSETPDKAVGHSVTEHEDRWHHHFASAERVGVEIYKTGEVVVLAETGDKQVIIECNEQELTDLRTQLAAAQRERDEYIAYASPLIQELDILKGGDAQCPRPTKPEACEARQTSEPDAERDKLRAEVARLTKENEKWQRRWDEKEKPALNLGREIERLTSTVAELQRDRERLNALDLLCKGYGCSGEHEGNRWVIDGPFADIRVAADDLIKRAAMRAKGEA